QEVRLAKERLRQRHSPPHAARESPDLLGRHRVQPGQPEHAPDFLVATAAIGHLLEDGHVVHELERREVAVEAGFLGHVAERPPDGQPVAGPERIASEQSKAAAVRGQDRGQDPKQRGLPRAVRPEQAGDAQAHAEAHRLESFGGQVSLAHVVDEDGRFGHALLLWSNASRRLATMKSPSRAMAAKAACPPVRNTSGAAKRSRARKPISAPQATAITAYARKGGQYEA